MFRIGIAIMIGGGVLIWYGCREYRVSSGASTEPLGIELAEIEKGQTGENNHLKVGPHVRVYPHAIYEYEMGKYESGGPKPTTKVNHTYYPIISTEHSFIQDLDALAKKYNGLENAPDEEFPTVKQIACLVKTSRFKTISAIPGALEESDSIQGLVINRIEELDDEEARLVRQSFPSIDLNRVLILEEGRMPSSVAFSFGAMAGGLVLIAGPLLMWFRGRGGDQEEDVAPVEEVPESGPGGEQKA